MFKIGDFSRLTQVSIKALRLYDEMGLFKAAYVDPDSGYRYYSADQMDRLNRIVIYKQLGFTLDQINMLLDGDLGVEQIREMLMRRQAEIERQLTVERDKLIRLEARLRILENEGGNTMSKYEVVLKKVEAVEAVTLRKIIPTFVDVGGLIEEVFARIAEAGVKTSGPVISIYHEESYKDADIDMEAAIPVVPGSRLKTSVLPVLETAACTIHNGPYENLKDAYAVLGKWIEENGYTIKGPSREIYLISCSQINDPAQFVTEIQIPVVKG